MFIERENQFCFLLYLCIYVHRHIVRHTDRHTERHTVRHTDRNTDRHTVRHTDRHTDTFFFYELVSQVSHTVWSQSQCIPDDDLELLIGLFLQISPELRSRVSTTTPGITRRGIEPRAVCLLGKHYQLS